MLSEDSLTNGLVIDNGEGPGSLPNLYLATSSNLCVCVKLDYIMHMSG